MESNGPEQVYAVDRFCIVEWLIKPMYMRLVELLMWQLHGGAMAKVGDGMFLLDQQEQNSKAGLKF
jgi:hypothetical protein